MFDQLPSAQSRSPRSLVLSLAIHVSLCVAILAAGFTVQSIVAPTRTTSVRLIAQMPIPPMKRRTIRPPKPTVATFAKPPIKLTAPPSEPASTVLTAPQPILAIVAKQPSEPPVLKEVFATAAPAPKANTPAKVQLGGFSTASTSTDQAIPKLQVAAGFGDAGIATPIAPRRSVSSSGFGDAAVASASANSSAQVRSSGFGDAVSAAPATIAARPPTPPPATSAQILAKPRPAYTEEARRLEIEGEVQLEVVFGASGEVHILRVVRGLGHGLDENAVIAAKAIRFLPAKRDGHTVDSTATVHIIFQLAS
jgi:TonB family protein